MYASSLWTIRLNVIYCSSRNFSIKIFIFFNFLDKESLIKLSIHIKSQMHLLNVFYAVKKYFQLYLELKEKLLI